MEDKFNNIDETLLLEDEKIAKYLKGMMTAEEEQEFMQELDSNEDLKSKAIATARLVKGMKEAGTARDEEIAEEMLAHEPNEITSIAKRVVRKKKTKIIPFRKAATWLSAAASVALLVWGGFRFNDYRKTTGLGEEYSTIFIPSEYTRGDDNEEFENRLATLVNNVASKQDLDNTLNELTSYWEQATLPTVNEYSGYGPEIGWNLAVGHLRNNDRKKAKEVLEKLIKITTKDSPIGKKARELLKRIEDL